MKSFDFDGVCFFASADGSCANAVLRVKCGGTIADPIIGARQGVCSGVH